MTDCIHCHKLFSGKCKQCSAHMAELASFKYKIDNHVHNMARVAWRLQPDGSLPSEADNMVSSQPPTPLSTNPVRETQRRHILSYPTNTTFLGVPACKLSPMKVSASFVSRRFNHCGESPQGAYFHQVHVVQSVEHRVIKRRNAKCPETSGSNPIMHIPASLDTSFLSVHGAGSIFSNTTNPIINPAPILLIGGKYPCP